MGDTAEILDRLERDGIEHLWISYHDYSGRSCAKTVPKASFRSAVTNGVVFAMANLNMDARDHQVEGATLLADSGDFLAVPDPRSYAVLPQFEKTARMHAWMRATDGGLWQGCPRTRLDATVEELKREGYSVQAALEPEFYLMRRDERGDLSPVNRTWMFSTEGLALEDTFVKQVMNTLAAMGVDIPQLGKEYGHGQYEMACHHGSPMQAIDDYFSLKEVVREAARRLGYIATFMPKLYPDWVGNSLHVHLSLWDADGARDLTPATTDNTSLSQLGQWFMGGLLAHAAALTGLGSPTVNSYKRLLPGSWAPANTYWGYGNRSGVIRIPGVGSRRHLEYRSGDNTCQPYLFMTGLLAAGLDGIRKRIDPGPPLQKDIGHLTQEQIEAFQIGFLPRTLPDALAALEADEVIGEAVGQEALRHFLLVKRNELADYNLEVHAWERSTYLEVP